MVSPDPRERGSEGRGSGSRSRARARDPYVHSSSPSAQTNRCFPKASGRGPRACFRHRRRTMRPPRRGRSKPPPPPPSPLRSAAAHETSCVRDRVERRVPHRRARLAREAQRRITSARTATARPPAALVALGGRARGARRSTARSPPSDPRRRFSAPPPPGSRPQLAPVARGAVGRVEVLAWAELEPAIVGLAVGVKERAALQRIRERPQAVLADALQFIAPGSIHFPASPSSTSPGARSSSSSSSARSLASKLAAPARRRRSAAAARWWRAAGPGRLSPVRRRRTRRLERRRRRRRARRPRLRPRARPRRGSAPRRASRAAAAAAARRPLGLDGDGGASAASAAAAAAGGARRPAARSRTAIFDSAWRPPRSRAMRSAPSSFDVLEAWSMPAARPALARADCAAISRRSASPGIAPRAPRPRTRRRRRARAAPPPPRRARRPRRRAAQRGAARTTRAPCVAR